MVTEAECKTTVGNQVDCIAEFLAYCNSNASRFTNGASSQEETLLGGLQTDYHFFKGQTESLAQFRSSLDHALKRGPSLVESGLREYGRFIDAPETDARGILARLYKHYQDNALRVKSRGFSAGTPAAPVTTPLNSGNGLVNRLSVDENGYVIEAGFADDKVCRCVADEHSGARRHEERFELVGQDSSKDELVLKGSGRKKIINALSARNSLNFIRNPSFSSYSGSAAAPSSITDWTIAASDLSNIEIETTITYRDYDGEGTETSLKWTAPTSGGLEINQTFADLRLQLVRNIPVYFQFAVYKVGTGGSGTVYLDLGGITTAQVNVSDLNNGDWTVVRATTGTTAGGNSDNWYKNIKTTSPIIDLNAQSVDLGRVLYFDDIVVSPYTYFDGSWYAIVGGDTKFLVDDYFTWSDSSTDAGVLQYWFWRLFNAYLPHTNATTDITWTDPA